MKLTPLLWGWLGLSLLAGVTSAAAVPALPTGSDARRLEGTWLVT